MHAELAPSSAHRWLECPGSVALSRGIDTSTDTPATREGTQAHAVMEAVLTGADLPQVDEGFDRDAMTEAAHEMAAIVAELGPGRLLVEHKVDTGIPGCTGTADVVHLGDDHLTVIDLKYGRHPVQPFDNSQLMLYAAGAIREYLIDDPARVTVGIFQPRAGGYRSWTLTPDVLRYWIDRAKPIAAEALAGSTRFAPSASACKWCPASGSCRARSALLGARDFHTDPLRLTPGEVAEILSREDDIRSWLDSVHGHAQNELTIGATIPGWGLRERPGARYVADDSGLISRLTEAGYLWEDTTRRSAQTIGQLDKLVGGADRLAELAGPTIATRSPSISVVPEDQATVKPGEAFR